MDENRKGASRHEPKPRFPNADMPVRCGLGSIDRWGPHYVDSEVLCLSNSTPSSCLTSFFLHNLQDDLGTVC